MVVHAYLGPFDSTTTALTSPFAIEEATLSLRYLPREYIVPLYPAELFYHRRATVFGRGSLISFIADGRPISQVSISVFQSSDMRAKRATSVSSSDQSHSVEEVTRKGNSRPLGRIPLKKHPSNWRHPHRFHQVTHPLVPVCRLLHPQTRVSKVKFSKTR